VPLLDTCHLKISLPLFVVLLVVAQLDLASAAGWPNSLLALLHLTAANNDLCRGMCAGIGASIDVLVVFQLARIVARRSLETRRDPRHD
jgi:hypothetical protein